MISSEKEKFAPNLKQIKTSGNLYTSARMPIALFLFDIITVDQQKANCYNENGFSPGHCFGMKMVLQITEKTIYREKKFYHRNIGFTTEDNTASLTGKSKIFFYWIVNNEQYRIVFR